MIFLKSNEIPESHSENTVQISADSEEAKNMNVHKQPGVRGWWGWGGLHVDDGDGILRGRFVVAGMRIFTDE